MINDIASFIIDFVDPFRDHVGIDFIDPESLRDYVGIDFVDPIGWRQPSYEI